MNTVQTVFKGLIPSVCQYAPGVRWPQASQPKGCEDLEPLFPSDLSLSYAVSFADIPCELFLSLQHLGFFVCKHEKLILATGIRKECIGGKCDSFQKGGTKTTPRICGMKKIVIRGLCCWKGQIPTVIHPSISLLKVHISGEVSGGYSFGCPYFHWQGRWDALADKMLSCFLLYCKSKGLSRLLKGVAYFPK